jgi:hypothetical protein
MRIRTRLLLAAGAGVVLVLAVLGYVFDAGRRVRTVLT